jgi:Na+-transporting methylmalonyl-CoA/oxaloacetate decarboxylase gamma subunit
MKKILLLFVVLIFSLNCFAKSSINIFSKSDARENYTKEQTQALFNQIDTQMTISEIASTLDISPLLFLRTFSLEQDEINELTLFDKKIPLDAVYQMFYLEIFRFNDFSIIEDICQVRAIPINQFSKKINQLKGKDLTIKGQTLRSLTLETLDIQDLILSYKDSEINFVSMLVILGISLVFIVLFSTSIIIKNFSIFSGGKKKKTLDELKPSIVNNEKKVHEIVVDMEEELEIVAAIMAIHKMKIDTITDHKINLTWRRANINMWGASAKIETSSHRYNILKTR